MLLQTLLKPWSPQTYALLVRLCLAAVTSSSLSVCVCVSVCLMYMCMYVYVCVIYCMPHHPSCQPPSQPRYSTTTHCAAAVAGSADAGKSTLVAAMTQRGADGGPLLDDGRGLARVSVFRHKHELQSGRTSSLSEQLLSYSDDGHALNYHGWQSGVSNTGSDGGSRSLDAPSVVGQASSSSAAAAASQAAARTPTTTRVVHFLDLGGAQRCMKTALYGLTCMLPGAACCWLCSALPTLGHSPLYIICSTLLWERQGLSLHTHCCCCRCRRPVPPMSFSM